MMCSVLRLRASKTCTAFLVPFNSEVEVLVCPMTVCDIAVIILIETHQGYANPQRKNTTWWRSANAQPP